MSVHLPASRRSASRAVALSPADEIQTRPSRPRLRSVMIRRSWVLALGDASTEKRLDADAVNIHDRAAPDTQHQRAA
jgi:hypothetical protein